MKAVSTTLTSPAMERKYGSAAFSNSIVGTIQTEAGFPLKGVLVKALTEKTCILLKMYECVCFIFLSEELKIN